MLTRSLVLLVLTGCGLDDSTGPRGEAWTRIDVSISADYESGVTAPEALMVHVDALTAREDPNFSNRIPATITVAPDGGEPLVVPDEGLVLTGIASSYEIHAVVPELGIDLTRQLAAPTFYAVEVPSLSVGGAAQIRWSPANQLDVETAVRIDTPSNPLQPTTFHTFYGPETDVGVIDVPGTGFPNAADYVVYVTRAVEITEDEPGLALSLFAGLGAVVATHTVQQ